MPIHIGNGEWRYESAEDFVHLLHRPGDSGGSGARYLDGVCYELSPWGPREVPSFVIDTLGSGTGRIRMWVSKNADETYFRNERERDSALVEHLNDVIPAWPCESRDPRSAGRVVAKEKADTVYGLTVRQALQKAVSVVEKGSGVLGDGGGGNGRTHGLVATRHNERDPSPSAEHRTPTEPSPV